MSLADTISDSVGFINEELVAMARRARITGDARVSPERVERIRKALAELDAVRDEIDVEAVTIG
jgi:hypothetical protein